MEKALSDIEVIISYTKNKTYEEIMSDGLLVDGIMFRLIQLIENIKNISEEFKVSHPEIPWGDIMGFRNGIVHEYGKTDYITVYETITHDLTDLKAVLKTII